MDARKLKGATADRLEGNHSEADHSEANERAEIGRQSRTVFDVAGLCCQSEVSLIEDSLAQIKGIDEFSVNIAAGTLAIYHDGAAEREEEVVDRLDKAGLKAKRRRSVGRAADLSASRFSAHFWVIVAGVLLTGLGAFLRFGLGLMELSVAVFIVAIGVGGFFVFRQALAGFRQRQFNIPVLVTIAVIGAGFLGEWLEASAVAILFAFAEWLEGQSMSRARREIGALMELAPQVAMKLEDDGSVHEIPVEEVDTGDRLRVLPGARIPVDAVIVEGRTELDESTITGESVPVVKTVDEQVFAGTINGAGALTLRATQPASRSTLARIIDAIEDARANQSQTEQFIDRFAQIYTPAVVIGAVLVATIPPLFFGAVFLDWFYRSLVFLVIACPCALVISTPIANVAGLARAARDGVLIKGGKFLELLGALDAVAFDKTGTMTAGRPEVEDICVWGEYGEDQILLIAAQVEAQSEHHVGRAILQEARHRWPSDQFIGRAREVNALVGRGIEAHIDSEPAGIESASGVKSASAVKGRVGNLSWLREECGLEIGEDVAGQWEALEKSGQTVVGVALDDALIGLVAMRDALRPQALRAVEALRQQGVEQMYLITGDNWTTARRIGAELGFAEDAVSARLLPEQKVARIEELRQQHKTIAMVGDGVNDAPALAGASVGIAMGAAGTDVALESADVALMADDLERLPDAIEIGRRTTRVIRQNIVIALGFKAVFLVLAVLGIATLWMAIVADMGASLIVIFNAIRLLRDDKPKEVSAGVEGQPRVVRA